jgi:hypothetical protein
MICSPDGYCRPALLKDVDRGLGGGTAVFNLTQGWHFSCSIVELV